ncbi:MAG TPA: hypothetical protein DIW31_09625 [Bacteroidales bacterium]|nr:hypothetical protein [Bacteroidales bacterium]
MKKGLLFISIFILYLSGVYAQNTCGDQLKIAQRRFDDGLLEDIPQLLAGCMKNGFTDEEKTNAYKLLIQTYLYNEQPEKADEVMLAFLKEFPNYVIAQNDPKEFINLHKTYRTEPIFKIEVRLSGLLNMARIVEPNSTGNSSTVKTNYKPLVGVGTELNYINRLSNDFDYSIGISFAFARYSYTSVPLAFTKVTGTYTDMYFGLPLSLRYNFKYKRVNLFAKAGIEPVYLISSKVQLERKDEAIDQPYNGTVDLTNLHRRFDVRPILAFGPTVKFGKGNLRLTVEIKFGFIGQLIDNNKYKNLQLQEKFMFVEDNLKFNQLNLSLAYIRPIYNPKKINF